MPMYEYRCGSCGSGFERYFAGFVKQAGQEKCPRCGKESVEKVFSTFASGCCGSSGGGTSSGGCGGSGQFS